MLFTYGFETADKAVLKVSFEGKPAEKPFVITIDKANKTVTVAQEDAEATVVEETSEIIEDDEPVEE